MWVLKVDSFPKHTRKIRWHWYHRAPPMKDMEVRQRSLKIARPCWWDVEERRAELMRMTEAGPVQQNLQGCGCRMRNMTTWSPKDVV